MLQGPAEGCRSALLPQCHLGSRRVQGNARGQHCAQPPAADSDTHVPRGCKETSGVGRHGPGTQSQVCKQAHRHGPRTATTRQLALKRLEHREGTRLTVQPGGTAASGRSTQAVHRQH